MNEQRKNFLIVGLLILCGVLLIGQWWNRSKTESIHPSLIPVNVSGDSKKVELKTPYEQNQVRNTIGKYNADIQKCYLKHLEKPNAISLGRVQIDWQISPSGETLSPQVVSSNMNDQEFGNCIVEKVKTFKFPPPPSDKPVYTTFTYVFHKEGESLGPQLVTTGKPDKKK